MKILKAVVATSLIIGMMPIAQADTLYGLYTDANYWRADTTVNDDSDSFDTDGAFMVSASIEHGVPVIPNARIKYTNLNTSQTMIGLDTDIKVTNTDLIAYYEVLDNVVSVDVGLGAKMISSSTKYGSNSDGAYVTSTDDFDETLAMAYASAGAKLPFTGLSVKAEVGVAKGDDIDTTDAQAELQYNFIDTMAVDVGAKVGYRMMTITDDAGDNQKLETKFKGPYVGMEVHF